MKKVEHWDWDQTVRTDLWTVNKIITNKNYSQNWRYTYLSKLMTINYFAFMCAWKKMMKTLSTEQYRVNLQMFGVNVAPTLEQWIMDKTLQYVSGIIQWYFYTQNSIRRTYKITHYYRMLVKRRPKTKPRQSIQYLGHVIIKRFYVTRGVSDLFRLIIYYLFIFVFVYVYTYVKKSETAVIIKNSI